MRLIRKAKVAIIFALISAAVTSLWAAAPSGQFVVTGSGLNAVALDTQTSLHWQAQDDGRSEERRVGKECRL